MGGRMRRMSTTALLMTVLCLLLSLHQTHQEEVQQEVLKPGAFCEGEMRKLCPSGTICQLGDEERRLCRKRAGQSCKSSDPYDYCESGTQCDKRKRICGKKVGSYCYSSFMSCGAGHECKDSKCSCIPEQWRRKKDVCVPVKGYVGAKCLENNVCKSPHSQCDKDTNRCVCKSNFLTSARDFSCKMPLGGDCTDNSNCTEDAFCDHSDNTCRLKTGEDCTGNKANFCQVGKPCIDGYCRNRVGESCERSFNSRLCEPPSTCWYKTGGGSVCGIDAYDSCANNTDSCAITSTFCDPKLLLCQKKIGEYCYEATNCPYGAACIQRTCQCHPGGYWNATGQVCVPPEGKVGGKCRSDKNQCEDHSAKCNDDGVCECKKGFHPDNHSLDCVVKGPRCFIDKYGFIETFFGESMRVDLPCGFKLAKFRCGDTLVEVFADNTFTPKIKNTYISAINVTITGKTKAGTTATNTFTIEYLDVARYLAKNKTKGSAWRVTPGQDPPVKDDNVQLFTRTSTRDSILLRKLLRITYIPVDMTRTRFFGEVLIQCGMKTFKSLEKFPVSLCGRPEDKEEGTYKQYAERVEKKLRKEIPDTYPYVSSSAFSSDRLADRAVLLEQTVSQRNAYCQEASAIVKSGCPALQTKLYNCSYMYATSLFYFKSYYTYCTARAIPEPAKLLTSCLNVNCNRLNGDNKKSTCQTLKTASQACHKISGSQTPSDLRKLAKCTST